MKVYIPSKTPTTGKGFFCKRLSDALKDLGVTIVPETSKADISLDIVKRNKTKAKKRIIRLDGVYHNLAMNYKSQNSPIKSTLMSSDGVVYQSEFSKNLCDKYLGKFPGKKTIIPNGILISNKMLGTGIRNYRLGRYKHIFTTASRWRPHKRLNDTIKAFVNADIPDSVLYIAGDLKKSGVKRESLPQNVVYLGVLKQFELDNLLQQSTAFVHLCWFDNCPNSVVEAIGSNTPVITNNVGGTRELIEKTGYGIICDIDKPYDFKPVQLYKPPKINIDKVSQAMNDILTFDKKPNFAPIDISMVAKSYLSFFEGVLNE